MSTKVSVKLFRAMGISPSMAAANQASSCSVEVLSAPPMPTVHVLGVSQLARYAETVAAISQRPNGRTRHARLLLGVIGRRPNGVAARVHADLTGGPYNDESPAYAGLSKGAPKRTRTPTH